MLAALLIGCFLLALIGVVSKIYLGRRLEDRQQELNDALLDAQRTATERHQNENLLAAEEDQERRLKAQYESLVGGITKARDRLSGTGSSAPG